MKNPFRVFGRFGARITVVLILCMLFSAALSDILISKFYLETQFNQLRLRLITAAQVAAMMVDAEALAIIPLTKEGIYTPEYRKIEKVFSSIKSVVPSVTYIYTLVQTKKPGILKFVVDLNIKQATAEKSPAAFPGEEYDASRFPEMLRGFSIATADTKLMKDEWGVSLSGYAPIKDRDGSTVAILGMDMSANEVFAAQKRVHKRSIFVFGVGVILSIVIGTIMSRRLSRPIKELIDGTRHIARGELDYRVEVHGADEIADLAELFNKMSKDLKVHVDELERTTAERERLHKELEIAKGIQQSFLPKNAPQLPGFDIAVMTIPAREVGGDFYDFIPIDSDNLGLAVADVSGKGIPAALFMAISRTLLRASATGNALANEAVRQANKLMMEDSRTNMFVTLFYTILNKKDKTLHYVNAGHNPPLLLREDQSDLVLLKAKGIPLGLVEENDIATERIQLKKGDVIALYTDGIVEARNEFKEMFELDRLADIVRKNRNVTSRQIVDKTYNEVSFFVKNQPQFDDMTLMVIKVS